MYIFCSHISGFIYFIISDLFISVNQLDQTTNPNRFNVSTSLFNAGTNRITATFSEN